MYNNTPNKLLPCMHAYLNATGKWPPSRLAILTLTSPHLACPGVIVCDDARSLSARRVSVIAARSEAQVALPNIAAGKVCTAGTYVHLNTVHNKY